MKRAITSTTLHGYQEEAVRAIIPIMGKGTTKVFLEGVQSSGKTLVSLEILLRLIRKDPQAHGVIYVPPTCIGSWKLQVTEHYKHLVPQLIEDRIIFFLGSQQINDHVRHDVRGKVLIKTATSAILNEVCDEARYTILDEAHRLKEAYQAIVDRCPHSSFIFLSGSSCALDHDVKYTMADVGGEGEFPDLEYSFHVCAKGEGYMEHVIGDICENEGDRTNIMVVDSAVDAGHIATLKEAFGDSFWDYSRKGSTTYKKYDTQGGVLYTSYKLISEGNNFNSTSLMYILYPHTAGATTLAQLVRRIYRVSSQYDTVRVIFVMPRGGIDVPWVRCRLAVGMIQGFESKDGEKIRHIVSYLEGLDVSPYDLSDEEMVLIFGSRLHPTSEVNLTLSFPNVTKDDMIALMSI